MNIKRKLSKLFRCGLTAVSPCMNTKIVYLSKFHRRVNLKNPKKLNDKILWLKFNDYYDNELVKQCADKYKVREYIEKRGCGEILNDLISVYDNADLVDWDSLPNSCAIKLNIGCGCNHIVTDLENEDKKALYTEIKTWFRTAPEYYLGYAEMQYKDVKPYLIVEKYLGGPNGELPVDYKFYCMNGKVQLIMMCTNRDEHGHGAQFYYMDREWNLKVGYDDDGADIEKPKMLQKAIEYAEALSVDFPFVRVDFYLFEDRVVFGELSFTPAAGMDVDHNRIVDGTNQSIDDYYGRILKINS